MRFWTSDAGWGFEILGSAQGNPRLNLVYLPIDLVSRRGRHRRVGIKGVSFSCRTRATVSYCGIYFLLDSSFLLSRSENLRCLGCVSRVQSLGLDAGNATQGRTQEIKRADKEGS